MRVLKTFKNLIPFFSYLEAKSAGPDHVYTQSYESRNVIPAMQMEGTYRILFGKREEKWLLGSDRYRLDDNIKLDIKATRYKGVGWIHPAKDRVHLWTVLNPIMNIRIS
jgi:hypothetical protein